MDTIEHPITGEKIQIGKVDFLFKMNWDLAIAECNALGNGWRLPSIEELNEIYLKKNEISGLVGEEYWSSSESVDEEPMLCGVLSQSFNGLSKGSQGIGNKQDQCCVRAVRSL